jgi:ABC-type siderophore export system fused ATPase/permease subunit
MAPTINLLTGQRKRFAVVRAYPERPTLVFDEWTADLDPPFRRERKALSVLH